MFILDHDATIATRFGSFAFAANVPTHVPPEAAREVIAAGAVFQDPTGTAEVAAVNTAAADEAAAAAAAAQAQAAADAEAAAAAASTAL